ncbi:small secreted [Pyrenophora seminiperda CCB06]|uniref:Small secreted n=1 Tax=Pyrenophora seminiperda CCB06 TaxID=1302712 RepID=A0A3M7MDU0_9PLEO|nr:small secreted [Pyrenophora seminiperda CCB06]
MSSHAKTALPTVATSDVHEVSQPHLFGHNFTSRLRLFRRLAERNACGFQAESLTCGSIFDSCYHEALVANFDHKALGFSLSFEPITLYSTEYFRSFIKMYFHSIAILSLAAFSFAAPTPNNKRTIEARQGGAAVLADTTYNAISIAGGVAGNAKAEAAAVFKALDLTNLKNIASADLTFLNTVNQVANDAEKQVFNPAVDAATGDKAAQIQNGKIKNKVLKLTATVLKLQAQQAQGQDVAATLAEETKKFNNNVALDVKAAGQVSVAEPFTATISGSGK